MKAPLVLILMIALVVLVVGARLYLYEYQRLLDEGSRLADMHCIVVNPLIAKRKELYLKGMERLLKHSDGEGYLMYNDLYADANKKYIDAEQEWLSLQDQYLNRWDTKMVLDPTVREAAVDQTDMYRAEMVSAGAIGKLLYAKDEKTQKELSAVVGEQVEAGNQAEQKYEALLKTRARTFDIRNFYLKNPESQCPAADANIPDVNQNLHNLLQK